METRPCAKCNKEYPLSVFGVPKYNRKTCNKCRVIANRNSKSVTDPTPEQLEARRRYRKKYNSSEKGKAAAKRYRKSREYYRRRWAQTPAGKASLAAASKRSTSKKRAWVQAEKLKSGCIDCGYNKHHAALDYDHVRGEKKFEVSKTMGRCRSVMIEEISKCVVRCSNCHRIKTFEDRQRAEDKKRIK